jgi:2-C-methyl-D-erythritol 2,4-cyclodiphosphate synthase
MNDYRIGHGYDVHRLVTDRKLILGGIEIDYEMGLMGHSDADVVAHAVIDSLFGAAALGDIGTHFPDTDEKYKDADSMELLSNAHNLIREEGYSIANIDVTIIAQNPKLSPFIESMRGNLSEILEIPMETISIKAKTNEKIGFTGRGEGIAAFAVTLIRR